MNTLLISSMRRRISFVRRGGDQGVALVSVVGTVMVLTLLVVSMLAYATQAQKQARGDQDWQAALAAANAGVDDYISRLNDEPNYWKYGNPASPYTTGSSVSLPTGALANAAFSGWTDVPGSSGRSQYRYEVNTSSFYVNGVIKLRSTGLVGKRTRTIETTIGRRNFLDYLYFTDYEVKDPAAYVKSSTLDDYTADEARTNCNKRLYEGPRRDNLASDATGVSRDPGCTVIRFVTGDEVRGPMHSNDAIYICGTPKFTSEASTSYTGSLTGGRHYVRDSNCSGSKPTVGTTNDLALKSRLTMPPNNLELTRQVDPAYTDNNPGCLYTGPTEITLRADGKMDVTSPWSKDGGLAWCGTGSGVSLPDRGVIWVRNVPSVADGYVKTGLAKPACATTGIGNPVGYPKGGDLTPYSCTAGDAFVSGNLKGQLTIGTENNIVVTDDLRYATTGCSSSTTCLDVLGLVANNYVEVYHPVKCTTAGSSGCEVTNATVNLQIDAAILGVAHSFRVQNYQAGSGRGNLSVNGAIGQKYRGIVGTGSGYTGFIKDYEYDYRLRYASPPHFLDPVQSAYGTKIWTEQTPAYKAP